METRHHNYKLDGSDIPLAVGDRQYAQDKLRDFWNLKEYASKILEDLVSDYANNIIIRGCVGSQGSGHTLSWTSGRVKVPHTIKTPTDWSALPPPMLSHTIPITIDIPAMSNQDISGATTDGVTVNYAKLSYNESSTSSRQRAKKAGTYDSEIIPTYTFTCNSTAPTSNEVAFALFTTDGATLTFLINPNRNNTIFGFNSLLNNTTGSGNNAFGYQSLQANTTGANNNAFGYQALYLNTIGLDNNAFGHSALKLNTTGIRNNAFGTDALSSNTTGSDNNAFGKNALFSNTTGIRNNAFGTDTLSLNTTGTDNNAFGKGALLSNTIGLCNNAFGNLALNSNTTGIFNNAFGHGALNLNTTGICNDAFGELSLALNTSGIHNCAFGYYALYSNVNRHYNCAFGDEALFSNDGGSNCAFGYRALYSNLTGLDNCAFGYGALYSNTAGAYNVAVGYWALYANTTGAQNCAFGHQALGSNITGIDNCAFGYSALSTSTSGTNSAFGWSAGSNITTGTNDTCLGNNAQPSTTTTSNEITLGNSSIGKLRCQVTTITALSDKRDKADIEDLPLGLDFINSIRPVRFHWDKREDYENKKPNGSKKSKNWELGIIAQEVDELQKKYNADWLRLVEHDNPDRLEATEGRLFMVIIKAIQELSSKINKIKIK